MPPTYGMNTRGLPGMLAPTYHELQVERRVAPAASPTWPTHASSALFSASITTAPLARSDEALVPWAWGVNACASVVGAIAATLAAIHFGFDAVLLAAIALYAGAALSAPPSAQASANPS